MRYWWRHIHLDHLNRRENPDRLTQIWSVDFLGKDTEVVWWRNNHLFNKRCWNSGTSHESCSTSCFVSGFSRCIIFEIPPRCCRYLPLQYSRCSTVAIIGLLFTYWWTFGLFPVLGFSEKNMLWTFLYVFVNICFCFFGYIPTSVNVGQFYKKLSNIFLKCLYHFTPTSYVGVQLLCYLYQSLVLPVLWIFITYWVCSGISFGLNLHFTNKKGCQNLFMSLLGVQIPSFVKCLHNLLPILKLNSVSLHYWFVGTLYIFWLEIFCISNILPAIGFLFCFLFCLTTFLMSFDEWKF